MNHAANSDTNACNVETRCTRLMMGDGGEMVLQPRLWFVAIRDIEHGEELSFDYGDSYWDYCRDTCTSSRCLKRNTVSKRWLGTSSAQTL
jgi:SET domain-containing protein